MVNGGLRLRLQSALMASSQGRLAEGVTHLLSLLNGGLRFADPPYVLPKSVSEMALQLGLRTVVSIASLAFTTVIAPRLQPITNATSDPTKNTRPAKRI